MGSLTFPVNLAAPGPIGATTPSTGAFTTISASGVITSTLATGTPPFTVASTTVVANLNASSLGGATFAAPGAIGGGTPAAGTFTTLGAGLTTLSGNLEFSAGSNIGQDGTTNRPATAFLGTGWNINNGTITASASTITLNTATGAIAIGTSGQDLKMARTATKTLTIDDNAGAAAAVIMAGAGTVQFGTVVFASLPASTNGTVIYCSNCDPALTMATCTSAAAQTGAFAFRVNGAWICGG